MQTPERIILGDPSFKEYTGHCFEYLRSIAEHLAAAGHEIVMLGNRGLRADLAEKTGALRTFTHWCDARPVTPGIKEKSKKGREHIRQVHEDAIFKDLEQADNALRFTSRDILVLNTLRHWPLRGLARWAESLGESRAPRIVLILHFTAFPSPEHDDGTNDMYRAAFAAIEQSPLQKRFVLLADSQELIEEYKLITCLDIRLAPIPHSSRPASVDYFVAKSGKIIVSYVGEARYHKGFHLLPGLINGFARMGLDALAHFHVQSYINSPSDDFYVKTMNKITAENVTFFPDQLDDSAYQNYLDIADIILVPYLLDNYHRQTSGIYAESVAMGKVTIVSRGTWMARQVRRYGGGRLFIPNDGVSLLDATAEAVRDYQELKTEAASAAAEWNRFHSSESFSRLVFERLNESEP